MTVSVVIPTRDRWEWLSRALRSALEQREVETEVIVVDDGSDGPTAERLATLEGPRVRVVRHERSRGVAAARNAATAAARGEWIAFLDDDDVWAPHRLADQLEAIERVGAAWGWCAVVWVDEELRLLNLVPAAAPEDLGRLLRRYNAIGTPSCVVAHRDALRGAGPFDERLSVMADWDLYLRLEASARGAACPRVLVAYVEHGANMHVVDHEHVLQELRHLRERYGAGDPEAFSGPDLERWVAYTRRRGGERRAAAGLYWRLARRHRSPKDLMRIGLSLSERDPRRVRLRGTPEERAAERWIAPFRAPAPG